MSATLQDPFVTSVNEWIDRAQRQADQAYRATVTDALARVKELTPVKTGYLRANWTVGRAGDATAVEGTQENPEAIIATLKFGDSIIIFNPVVYARRIEFGFHGTDSLGRHYDQHGAGMMQQTMTEMPAIAQRAVARVRSGGAVSG